MSTRSAKARKAKHVGTMCAVVLAAALPFSAVVAIYVNACLRAAAAVRADELQASNYRAEARSGATLRSLVAVSQAALMDADIVYSGVSQVTATTRFSQAVQAMARASSAEVRSVSLLPPEETGKLEKLAIAIDFSIQPSKLPELVLKLQRQRPWMFVKTFNVSSDTTGPQNQALWIRLTASAFRLDDDATQ